MNGFVTGADVVLRPGVRAAGRELGGLRATLGEVLAVRDAQGRPTGEIIADATPYVVDERDGSRVRPYVAVPIHPDECTVLA